ncbi:MULTISPECIES: hypothetical protein [unclassified Frigoribacterium]|uniref:hypothetical protein n=1 Tax=unclassified Frigoribacterium TaxID=2627005 RepID=UPI0012FCCEFA|nr:MULTISPECIES: hypothetical protein [unclassified Frigoribacterium]
MDGLDDERSMVAHHLVTGSKGDPTLDRDGQVLQAICVERVAVPAAAVEFEGDDAVDDDVDAATVPRADPGLRLDPVPQTDEGHPHDALDEALASGVGPVDDASHVGRGPREGLVQSDDREVTAGQCPVQQGDRLVERCGHDGVHQRGSQGYGPGRPVGVVHRVFVVAGVTWHRLG